MPTVLAIGLATLDVIHRVDALPGPDQKIVSPAPQVGCGGPAANAAITAAALGCEVRLATRLGPTPIGRLIAADLARWGVTVHDAVGGAEDGDSPWQPPVASVLVTAGTGDRAVISGQDRHAPRRTGELPGLDGIDAVLCDGHYLDLAVPVASAARAAGIPVLVDAGSWKDGLDELLAVADAVLASADFRTPAGPGLEDIASLGPDLVARSHGGDPIELWEDGRRGLVPVPRVEVCDTLGAGDVLHGTWVSWVARHGLRPFADALAAGAEVASGSCAHEGAHGWIAGSLRRPLAAETASAVVREAFGIGWEGDREEMRDGNRVEEP